MSVKLGAKRVCRRCSRVIMAVSDPRVISLTAGIWVHTTWAGRRLCGYAEPEED